MKIFADKTFTNKLISLILPMTLQNFMFALVPLSDTVMLAALSQDAMSAVSLAAQVMFVLNLFIYALSAGCSMFAAQYWGKGDKASIEKLFGYTIRLTIPIVAVFAFCALVFPEGVMRIYTDVPEIITEGIPYLRIVSLSYIFMGIAMIYQSVLKNVGLVKQCTIASSVMVVMNICLNAVFIFGLFGMPEMGAAGAALATVLSNFTGFALAIYFSLKHKVVRLRIKNILHSAIEERRRFSRHTAPYLLNQLFWGFGFTMITVILGHLDGDVVAANSIVAVVKDMVSCFCYALGSGGSIVVGNELGAGRLEKAKEYGDRICRLTIVSGAILGLIAAALSPVIVSLFDLTPEAKHYMFLMLLMCSYYITGRSINATIIGGIFAAGGDTKFGFICDTLTMWAFIVPLGALAAFVFNWPVMVVYFILNLDEIIKLPAVFINYRKYNWVRNIVDTVEE
ncbi:MAG: MATE family efflux transporter [Saccharofermentans sp.]|nr:MATE family efflux transporter [Saccharofermentans sp.]